MKKIFLLLLLTVVLQHSTRAFNNYQPNIINDISIVNNIDNGWYEATIKYSNYSTGTNATYTLNVKVEYNHVVAIDFGDGASVHSGYNSHGYSYSGGFLSFDSDYDGNIVGASTTVNVIDSNGTRVFKIYIG